MGFTIGDNAVICEAHKMGCETGREDEREAIVRWLRMLAGKHPGTAYAGALLDAVDDIEAGEHLKPADEGHGT